MRDAPDPINVFVHLLDEDGDLITQHDSFDVWAASLNRGDVVAQLHAIPLDARVSPGRCRLQMGVYVRANETRLPVLIEGRSVADRLWLAPVEVSP
jgi:hypothetical protein